MKNFIKISALAVLTVSAIIASASAFAAPATSKASLNVRTGPGTSYHVVDTLYTGEQVEVTECVSNGWCRIEHTGPDGWVSSRYLTPITGGGSGGSGGGTGGSGSSSDPDCSFGITIGPSGPSFSLSCGDTPPPVAPAPPPPPPVADMVCFYKGNNYTGTKACISPNLTRPNMSAAWDDALSSFTLHGNAKVKLCQGANFTGLCTTYSSSKAVLNGNLNNRVSSYAVFTGAPPAPPAPPAPAIPVTYSTGPINLQQTWSADLDTGNVGAGGADIWYQAVTAVNKFIAPRNGAKLSVSGSSNRGYAGCSAASYSGNKISIWALPVGTYVCVRTNQGRISEFRLNGYNGTTMKLGYTTWAN